LRVFLKECEKSFSLQAEPVAGAEVRWLDWARQYADSIDPFKNGGLREIIARFDDSEPAN
jgi:hypothetical protein